MTPKLSVLLPVYNEAATLPAVLEQVRAVPLDLEIIVVDNCSDDGTRDLLQAMLDSGEAHLEDGEGRLRVAFQEQNKGKGASVRRALGLARGEWVIVQDADLEYDPQDFVRLLDRAERRDRPQAVFGTRLRRGTQSRETQPHTAFYWGRLGLTFVFRLLYGRALSDVATCYKLMRRSLALDLKLQGSGFELDFEIAAKLARRGARWAEIPIFYAPRTEREGKKIRAGRDGLGALWAFVKYRVLPL
jgi:dolichol-phosphate mannosyltransferase